MSQIPLKNTNNETVLGALFLGTLTIGAFFPLAFAGLTPLLGLIGTALFYKTNNRLPKIDHGILLCALILSGLLIASSLWSITPAASLSRAFKVTALCLLSCPLLFLCKEISLHTIGNFKKWAIIPLIAIAAILFIELKFSFPLYRFIKHIPADTYISTADLNKHVATLMLLAPFGIIFSMRSRFLTLSILLVILCGLVLSVTENQSAQLSVIIMMFAMPALLLMPHAAPRIAFCGAAILIIFMPWFSPVAFDAFAEPLAQKDTIAKEANISMRLENWDFLSRRIMENPWTGFGMDTTRAMTFDTDQKYFKNNTIIHPHNMALQIWMEFGVAGVALTCALLIFLYRRLKSLPLMAQIIPFMFFGGTMVYLLVSWSAWASWLDGLILWLMALLILVTKPKAVLPPS